MAALKHLAVRLDRSYQVRMRPYSLDLRRKVVEVVLRGMPKAEAARTFGIGHCSVCSFSEPDNSLNASIVNLGREQPPCSCDSSCAPLPDRSPRRCKNPPMAPPDQPIAATA